jgi:hypothetical protein
LTLCGVELWFLGGGRGGVFGGGVKDRVFLILIDACS